MKAFDPALASPFHLDWLVPMDATTEDDYTRAVAERAETLLRSAQFLGLQRDTAGADLEVRVWVEAACGNACVSITYEPGVRRFAFHLLDESLRERLAVVVFHAVPCIDAEQSLVQADTVLDAALRALSEAPPGSDAAAWADRIREATRSVRVPVVEGPEPEAER